MVVEVEYCKGSYTSVMGLIQCPSLEEVAYSYWSTPVPSSCLLVLRTLAHVVQEQLEKGWLSSTEAATAFLQQVDIQCCMYTWLTSLPAYTRLKPACLPMVTCTCLKRLPVSDEDLTQHQGWHLYRRGHLYA